MEVRGVLDARSVAKVEEALANLEWSRPMPLYINLSNLDDFDSKDFEVFLQILFRFQDSYAYIRMIDSSERDRHLETWVLTECWIGSFWKGRINRHPARPEGNWI